MCNDKLKCYQNAPNVEKYQKDLALVNTSNMIKLLNAKNVDLKEKKEIKMLSYDIEYKYFNEVLKC